MLGMEFQRTGKLAASPSVLAGVYVSFNVGTNHFFINTPKYAVVSVIVKDVLFSVFVFLWHLREIPAG